MQNALGNNVPARLYRFLMVVEKTTPKLGGLKQTHWICSYAGGQQSGLELPGAAPGAAASGSWCGWGCIVQDGLVHSSGSRWASVQMGFHP